MLPEYIIYTAVPIYIAGYFFYFKDIFFGQTKPNLVSWSLWAMIPFLGAFFQIKAGAGLSVLPVLIAGFGPLLVVIVSLYRKNSYWKITKLDIACGILALLALIFYVLNYNLGISILFAVLGDMLAFIPTFVKSWKFPETEMPSVYLAGMLSNVVGLLIIKDWSFAIYSFGIYFVVSNTIELFILYHKKIFKIKSIS
jgi:hypothetical protein